MSEELVKPEPKEPWLTKREWAGALFMPYFAYDIVRAIPFLLRRERYKSAFRQTGGALRRMTMVQFLVHATVIGVSGVGVTSMGALALFGLLFLIFVMPSSERMANALEERYPQNPKQLTDGD